MEISIPNVFAAYLAEVVDLRSASIPYKRGMWLWKKNSMHTTVFNKRYRFIWVSKM